MGQHQSKDELLYQQVNYGNIEGIKTLRREGAGLEWIDREGKTPLTVACMKADFLPVVKTLIELGANVNTYRPGSHAGTPLHHAAKRGLDQTVQLLLSYGANALIMNDDCHTPLDVAREKGHPKVVRVIEAHICHFSGWLRELHLPGFLEALAPLASQWVTKKIWAVIVPRDSRNPQTPNKFELAIYPGLQVAQPRIIQLWKANFEEIKLSQSDPVVVIFDKGTRTRYKFLSANEGDKQQLLWFYNVCRGVHQVVPAPPNPVSAPTSTPEELQLAMAINASIQSAMEERPPAFPSPPAPEINDMNAWGGSTDNASHNGWGPPVGPLPPSKMSVDGSVCGPASSSYNGWDTPEAGPSANPVQQHQSLPSIVDVDASTQNVSQGLPSIPSAPPVPGDSLDDGPIHYPSIDASPIDIPMPDIKFQTVKDQSKGDDDASALCVICLDAPKEGVCIPCGHVVGCMSCLDDIKEKKFGCPVCRSKIDQVIKIYNV